MQRFKVIGDITNRETIAKGGSVRTLKELREKFGGGNWRKMKGVALVELEDGSERRAEVHWYEAHGIGKRLEKIKRLFPQTG